MPVTVIIGSQYGDEGKGKLSDYLSMKSDITIRFQGGDNAGHTVVNPFGKFKLHIIPCGIFNENTIALVGAGTVVNPEVLIDEIKTLESANVNTSNYKISGNAHILMPYHIILDEIFESSSSAIGTTKRGVGPAYADKARRINLRFYDLLDIETLEFKITRAIEFVNKQMEIYGYDKYSTEDIIQSCKKWSVYFKNHIVDSVSLLHEYLDNEKNILFEGQLGVMKDLDLGIYPYVTSSHTVAAYASVTSGIPMKRFDHIIGVVKAFSSAVGDGPFPTELFDETAIYLRGSGDKIDDEFGATTGRPRRIGWLDIPALNYAIKINGFTELALTKLDKLDKLDEIKICIGYEYNNKILESIPTTHYFNKVKPIYKILQGWKSDISKINDYAKLPQEAKDYISRIEELTNCNIRYIGNGPARENIIEKGVN